MISTNSRRHYSYMKALESLLQSGGGGCRAGLLRVANYGRLAGLAPQTVYEDLRASVRGARARKRAGEGA